MVRAKPTDMGMNRTGIGMSPLDSQALIDVTSVTEPSSEGDQDTSLVLRAPYLADPDPVGTMPPPSTLTGAAGTLGKMLKGQKLNVLLDKLGERLAFERTGSRLYDALIQKFRELGSDRVGPNVKDLMEIRDEEMRHFDLVRQTLEALGADPTTQTPCADVAAVASMGLLQVVTDPRTTKAQSLSAILVAELTDNAGWELLIDLAGEIGHDALARSLRPALALEMEHLKLVKSWVGAYTLADGGAKGLTQARKNGKLRILRPIGAMAPAEPRSAKATRKAAGAKGRRPRAATRRAQSRPRVVKSAA